VSYQSEIFNKTLFSYIKEFFNVHTFKFGQPYNARQSQNGTQIKLLVAEKIIKYCGSQQTGAMLLHKMP
jgi:hypothetical protein